MKKDLWLTIVVLVLVAAPFARLDGSELVEGELLKQFPERDFKDLHGGIKEQFGKKLTYTETFRGLSFLEHELGNIVPGDIAGQRMTMKNDSVEFTYVPYAFYFDVTYLFEYTVMAFPMTGVATIRFYATQATYSLHLVNTVSLVPYLTTPWGATTTYNSNPMAVALGMYDAIVPALTKVLIPHYDQMVKKLLLTRIAGFYEGYYKRRVNYLQYPFLRNSTVRIEDNLSMVRASQDGVHLVYETGADTPLNKAKGQDDETKYLRKVSYTYQSLAKILSIAPSRIQNYVLYPEDIHPDCLFQLDLKGLQHIFPDILLSNPMSRRVYASFSVAPETVLSPTYNLDSQTITLSSLPLQLSIFFEDSNQEILKAAVNVSATFTPLTTYDQSCQTVSLHFFAVGAVAKLVKAETLMGPEVPFNRFAVSQFVETFLSQHLMKKYERAAFGEGLVVSAGHKVALEKSEAVFTENGIEIRLA